MQVLYRLLSNPEYIRPLREEVDAVTTEEGWTKAGMDKMHKVDSFIRESQRVDGFFLRTLDPIPITHVSDPDFLPAFPSYNEPSHVAPVHIFQWCDCSRRHTCLHPG